MGNCGQKQQKEVQLDLRSVFPPPRAHPWLVFIHGKKGRNQTFYSLSENCVHVKSIPNMRGKSYCGNYFGWMILIGQHSGDCFLLNPVSMEKIQLPLWGNFTTRPPILSSPPDGPGCIVLCVDAFGRGRASFTFCRPGDSDWSHQDIQIGRDEHVHNVIPCGGRIYAIVCSPTTGKLVNLDIGEGDKIIMETEAILMLPSMDVDHVSADIFSAVVESCDELFLVTFLYRRYGTSKTMHVRDIVIQKMDTCKKECVKVESIGDRAFFVGSSCGASCSAKESGIQGNTVYFVMEEDKSLYAFELDEKSLTITLPCPDVKEKWSHPDWVLTCL